MLLMLARYPISLHKQLDSLSLCPPQHIPEIIMLSSCGVVLRIKFNHIQRYGHRGWLSEGLLKHLWLLEDDRAGKNQREVMLSGKQQRGEQQKE